jgi:Cu/Ag efflux protein CusF
MKRQTWFAALSALALAGTARAEMGTDQTTDDSMHQEQMPKKSAQKSGSFSSNQLTGEITSIDKSEKEITVKSGADEQTLKMGDNATVFLEGRLGSFEDLKEGQQVRAAYEPREEAKSLRWIEVNPPGGAAKPEQKPNTAPGGGADTGTGSAGTMDSGTTGTPSGGTAAGKGTATGAQAEAKQITGKVVSIDTANRQLVIDHQGRQWTIDVTNNAPVFVEGKKASLGEIREGQQVRASLDPEKTTRTATRLETVPAGQDKGVEGQGQFKKGDKK